MIMKLSAYIDNDDEDGIDINNENEFLSHPSDNQEPKHSLLLHSIHVAEIARDLLAKIKFQNPELGFFPGLLHDMGKLNPYYQILFKTNKLERDAVKSELVQKYADVHSPYSAWIAEKLLKKTEKRIDYLLLEKVVTLIYGHHTRLQRSI